MITKLLQLTHKVGWLMLIFGLLLQYGIKDRLPGLSLLFYGMPKPMLLALAVTLMVWPKVSWKSRFFVAVISLVLSWTWAESSWRSQAPTFAQRDAANEVRIMFWNLDRPLGLHQGMIDLVKEFQPHFAGFVEPGKIDMEAKCKSYEEALPGYQAAWMPRGILWLSKVPSRYRARGKLENIGAFARFEVNGLGPAFPVVVADVFQHPFHLRQNQLQEVKDHAQGHSDAILMGDFNTPLESVYLDAYRADFTNALEAAGQGFKETWPMGLPLLSLDQIWLGRDWEVVEARKVTQPSASDHAALLVTLRRR